MRKILIFLYILVISQVSLAGPDLIANGGDLVVCDSGNPFAYKLLDYYEREVFYPGTVYDFPNDDLGLEGKVIELVNRLALFEPGRASLYRSYLDSFLDQVLFVDGDLEDIEDSKHLVLPSGCKIKQFAIQLKEDKAISGKIYLIDKKLWDMVDLNTQMGLILHEIIYKSAIEKGHKDSIATRAFNSFILSQDFQSISKEEYDIFLQKNQLTQLEKHPGLLLDQDKNITFYDDKSIMIAEFKPGSYIELFGQKILISKKENSKIEFYLDGSIKNVKTDQVSTINFNVKENSYSTHELKFFENRISFSDLTESLNIFRRRVEMKRRTYVVLNYLGDLIAVGSRKDPIQVILNDQNVIISNWGSLSLYNSNTLKEAHILNQEIYVAGKKYSIIGDEERGSIVSFHPSGAIKSFVTAGAVLDLYNKSIPLKSREVKFSESGEVIGGTAWVDFQVNTGNGERLLVRGDYSFELYSDKTLKTGQLDPFFKLTSIKNRFRCHRASFYQSGIVSYCENGIYDEGLYLKGSYYETAPRFVYFYENGTPKSFSIKYGTDRFVEIQGTQYEVHFVSLHENGNIKEVQFIDDSILKDAFGRDVKVRGCFGCRALFDENEKLINHGVVNL